MNTKTLFLLATSMCFGLAHGESTITSATPYDFNTIIVSGTAGGSGTVTVGGTSQNIDAAGTFTKTFTGLTAGRLYQVSVDAGGTASTEVLMANGAVDRFSASAATGASVVSAGSWALSPVPTIDTEENKYVFAGSSNRFEATSKSTDAVFYVDSNMTFDDGADELAPMEALGAFTLAQTNENDSTDFFWAGLVKENSAAKWIALTANGVTAKTGTYVVRMEFDFSGSDAKVRYWIKSGAADFVPLKKGSVEWFDVAKNETGVSSVSYEGTGKLAQLTGSSVTAHVAQIGETKYASLPAALTAAGSSSEVTLLTNSRLTPTSELKGTYTLNSSPYDFRLLTAAGLEATYSGTTLTIADWVNSVTMSSSKTIGCDFTNGTVTVNLSNLHIQSGTTLSATVTVKDASGTTVAMKNGNFTAAGSLALDTGITAQNNYTYEVTVSDGSKTLAAATNSFVAGSEANWFSAKQGAWTGNGSWKRNGEATTIDTAKIALAGNQYDFVIGSARPGAPNGVVRVDTVVEVDGAIDNDDLEAIDKTGAQGMITIAETSAENPTAVWKAYVGNSWLTLAGENPEVANVTYTVRAEFDYRTSSKKVRYSVSKNGGNFAMLTYNSNEWLDNNVSEATTLTNTCAVGAGNLVSLAGSDINYYLASVDDTKYESMSSAFANAAFDSTVTMLWDATWKPNRAGYWTIGGSKNLTILDGGLKNKTSGNVIQVSDAKVAKVGATEYDFLDDAFDKVADAGTVQLLTNVVQGLAVTAPATANLDLNGCFVTFPSATLTVESGKTLFVTNGCNFVGGFNGTIAGEYKIAGGKWAAGEKDAGLFFDGYKMMPLSITETVDGVTYTQEAMKTQADPTKAAVVPVVIVNGTETNLSSVVVSNSFVEAYASGSTAAEKAASLNAPRDAGNKLTLIQSYVLGLTPTDATAKPVVNAVQNDQTDKVTLSLGNVKLNTSAGLPVKFTLKSMTTPGGAATEVETKSNDPSFAVPLYPTSASKVHYYKIDINFGK